LALRIVQLVVASFLILGGAAVIHFARQGRINRVMVFRVVLEGEDANLGAGVFAAFAILLGLFIFFAGVFRLDR
jgi:hypothetical protein